MSATEEIWHAYAYAVAQSWPRTVALALVGAILTLLALRAKVLLPGAHRYRNSISVGMAAVVIGYGTFLAIEQASLFDDTFISLRYARNLVDGHGLVFNRGERVEGYTNFLWTVLLAAGHVVTGVEYPLVALLGCLAAFVTTLLVTFRFGRRLVRPDRQRLYVPVAMPLLAVQNVFVEYGTSGLETGFAALLVTVAVYHLTFMEAHRGAAISGLCFALATLTRPDHALYYAAGGATLIGPWLLARWRSGRRPADFERHTLKTLGLFLLPGLLVVAHTLWRYLYYGDLVPNTYYAKAADQSYFRQGGRYVWAFYLATHFWLVVALIVAGAMFSRDRASVSRFFVFVGASTILYNLYIAKVGGDYMFGRFYVSLIPLYLLGAEVAVYRLCDRAVALGETKPLLIAAGSSGLLLSTAGGVNLFPPGKMVWHMSEQRSYYPVTNWFPVVVHHWAYYHGHELGMLYDQGFRPRIACSGIGMISFYGRMELFDTLGLTSKAVARRKLKRRGRPGHEKKATRQQVHEANVQFVLGGSKWPDFDDLSQVCFQSSCAPQWTMLFYDRDDMDLLREIAPQATFRDLPRYLDRYEQRLRRRVPPRKHEEQERLAHAREFFRQFYFEHNADPEREARLEAQFERLLPAPLWRPFP